MSAPRRTSGEINILAMLDGHARNSLSRRLLALPAAWWYGGAGLLACMLVGVLVCLAGESGKAGRGTAAVHAAAPAESIAEPDPVPDTLPGSNPPLRLETAAPAPDLFPAPGTDRRSAAAVPAPVEPALSPQARSAAPAAPRHASRSAARHAAAPPPKPAVRVAARTEPPARTRRAPSAARTRTQAVTADTDVALITAIIQHGGKQPDAALPDCPGGPCTFPVPER